jgi:gamma-glutamyltranspeptidase/glutathione hydrolase
MKVNKPLYYSGCRRKCGISNNNFNDNYGSKIYCDELGFLNNQMDDFSAKPGVPNLYGLTGTEANSIAPGKRMLSSMTPTIVEKDNKLFMVVGTPGGSTIITWFYKLS